MNSRFSFVLAAMICVVVGCIPSLNPMYTADDLVFDEAILGQWRQGDDDARWEFTKGDDTSYQLVITNKKGESGKFVAHLADLEGNRFLDLAPDPEVLNADEFYKSVVLPVHTTFLVKQTEPALVLASPDYKWLQQQLGDEKIASKFGERQVFTASTKVLQQMVVENVDKFTSESTLTKVP